MRTATNEALDALTAELVPAEETISGNAAWKKYEAGWRPRLGPAQQRAYLNQRAKYFLLDGERGSGKTVGALNMMVDRCFLNLNATGFIIVREVGQSKDGGAWDKLINFTLPRWQDGNRNPKTGERYDRGIGLEFSAESHDYETKKPYVWLTNRFGGSSKIISFSLPVGAQVEDKVKGKEASFILVDEAQTCQSDDYFTWLIQQAGRKHDIEGEQPVVYCANPEGPSHWLYKRFFPNDPDSGALIDEETGEPDEDYARYHIPIAENLEYLPEGYYDRVMTACKGNPIMFRRLVRGEWVDMPSGQAIFGEVFNRAAHVRGDLAQLRGLVPLKGHPIIVGYDLGPAHSSIHFMQQLPLADKILWLVFDELNFVGHYMPYRKIVPKILQRMAYWNEFCKTGFVFEHISDNNAFNAVRSDGSFDAQEIERLSGGKIRLKAAPKGPGTVAARSRMLMEMFAQQEVVISALCTKTIDMCEFMEGQKAPKDAYDPDAWLTPKKTTPHRHVCDSLTYPMFYYRVGGFSGQLYTAPMSQRIFHCGHKT